MYEGKFGEVRMYYWRVLLLLLDCVDVCWYFADGFDVCIYISICCI